MSALPAGWTRARVRDLIEIGPRTESPDDTVVGFVPLQRLGVTFRSRHTSEPRRWSEVKRGYTHFAEGDVLLARITPSFENGKAGVARDLPGGLGAGSTEYFVCRPHGGLLVPEYLLAYFKTRAFLLEGEQVMSGAVGQQRVPKQYVLDREIPLAPLSEQRRIVKKVDSLLARVDTCRERLDRIPGILTRFRQAVLAAGISGDLTSAWRPRHAPATGVLRLLESKRRRAQDGGVYPEDATSLPPGWALATGAEVVQDNADIVYGIVQPGPKLAKGVPYIRGMDIEEGQILEGQLMRTSSAIARRYARSAVAGGDVLLGIIRATKVAIVPDSLTGANITQGTARFRPSELILSEYLAIALEAPATQQWLHDHYRGIDMPGLNLADVRRVPIPLPSLEEQREIVRRVRLLLSATLSAAACLGVVRDRVNRLTQATLAKAFRGELVPHNPNEEPPEKLLARPHQVLVEPAISKVKATRRPAGVRRGPKSRWKRARR